MRLATGSGDGIKIWEADSDNQLVKRSELKGHKGTVNCLGLFKTVVNDMEQNKNIFAIDKSKLNEQQYLCSGGGSGDSSILVWDCQAEKQMR